MRNFTESQLSEVGCGPGSAQLHCDAKSRLGLPHECTQIKNHRALSSADRPLTGLSREKSGCSWNPIGEKNGGSRITAMISYGQRDYQLLLHMNEVGASSKLVR